MKDYRENEARTRNSFHYEISKEKFTQAFQTFKEMKMTKEDSNRITLLEATIEETYTNIEAEIGRLAAIAKTMDYHLHGHDQLAKLYGTLMHPNYKISEDWHDIKLSTDVKLKEIATKYKQPYEWLHTCFRGNDRGHCEKSISAKNIKMKGKGKGKKSQKKN